MERNSFLRRRKGSGTDRLPWQAISPPVLVRHRRSGDYTDAISNMRKEVGMRLEGHLDQAVENLIAAIKESDAYDKYLSALEAVKQQPGLKQKIDEFRRENYVMQNTGDMAFERMEQFEQANSDFREEPLVSDFLAAELALCRQIQQINFNITEALNFE